MATNSVTQDVDFRQSKEQIKAALAQSSQQDKNWKWHIKRINKESIVIGWSYLAYCGEGETAFKIIYDKNLNGLTAINPNGEYIDCTNGLLQKDIYYLIHTTVAHALHTY